VAIVHPCSRPDCQTLTMGELCLEHELLRDGSQPHPHRLLPRVVTASVLVAVAAAGALLRTRLPR
jgi:hypothetical protein